MVANNSNVFILTILLLLITTTNAHASFTPEAGKISYQIDESDRIIVGNVTNIQKFPDYSIVTIKVDEWLMGSIPSDEIEVFTEVGSTSMNENEPRFYNGESVILMLQDMNITENRFRVTIGGPGKHPITDREEIMNELEPMIGLNYKTIFIGLVFMCVIFIIRRSRNT